MFAGPHKAASTSIESFFYRYADSHSRWDEDGNIKSKAERKKTFGLRFWMWPRIHGVVANETEKEHPYKIFGHLVTDHDNTMLRDEILNGIRDAWETEGLEGVIIGTEMFDQVGEYAPYDAIHAMRKVVEYIRVEPSQVTVALNYRTPRLEQWASIWAHVREGWDTNATLEYEEWLCDPNQVQKHVEILQTQMNPFNAAEAFVKEGWNVRLIDMQGADEAGRDVNHVVACDVATARCDDGAVLNHKGDNPHMNSVSAKSDTLSDEQLKAAESLFRARDCAYMDFLRTNVKFAVVYNQSVWEDCNPNMTDVYNHLKEDPSLMYKALLGQLECPNGEYPTSDVVEIDEILSGKYLEKVEEGKGSTTSKSKKDHKRSLASILLEFFGFIFIVGAAMGYQYHRMVRERIPLGVGVSQIDTAAAMEEAEQEGQFTNNAAVGAEYGDPDDDEVPTGYRD